jgi:hypothetical protein
VPNRAAFHDAVARLLINAERDGSVLKIRPPQCDVRYEACNAAGGAFAVSVTLCVGSRTIRRISARIPSDRQMGRNGQY